MRLAAGVGEIQGLPLPYLVHFSPEAAKNVREQRSCESETDFEEPESNSREPGADQGESGNDQKESSCDSEEPEADFGGGQEVTGARAGLGIGQFPQLS
jgi:hypothetical protein